MPTKADKPPKIRSTMIAPKDAKRPEYDVQNPQDLHVLRHAPSCNDMSILHSIRSS